MKKGRTVTVAVIASAAVLAAVPVFFPSVAVEAVYPIERAWRPVSRAVSVRVAGAVRGAESRAENVRLRRELAALAVEREELSRLEAENARLRRALGYVERAGAQWIAAGRMSSGGAAAAGRPILRVDKGSLAGVEEGAVVLAAEGLVGVVASVTLHTAEIATVADRSVHVDCEVEGGGCEVIRGISYGGDDGAIVLRHLTGAADAPPRSRVVASGAGGVFPRGVEVGVWLGGGLVQPSVPLSSVEDVFIRRAQ